MRNEKAIKKAREEIYKAEALIRQARADTFDYSPVSLAEWEAGMRRRIECCISILEKHGSTYVMPEDLLTPPKTHEPKGMIEASFAGAPCSAAGVEAELGITPEKLLELIKPLVLLMHQKRLPFLTIKLNNGIATVNTVKPPNSDIRHAGPDASD